MHVPTQISYWTIGGFDGALPLAEAFDICADLGSGLELSFGTQGDLHPQTSRADCEQIKQLAADKGIQLRTMASVNYWEQSLSSPDPAERQQAVAFTQSCLQVAAWLELETILVIPGYVAVPWDESKTVVSYQNAWDNATESLKTLVPIAEDLGINIGLENVWNWFLSDPMSMKIFIDQFQSERIGSYFDVANCLINGYPEHWIEILGQRIKAVHVKNFQRSDCGGGLHGFGESMHDGSIDWSHVLQALDQISYQGPLTAELIPFSRLPDLNLPDVELARQGMKELHHILAPQTA